MMWIDLSARARELGKAAIRGWDSWTVGARRGWSREAAKLPKKYRKLTWISISVNRGWKKAKEIRDFYHRVISEAPEADPAIFEEEPAANEQDPGVGS